MVRSSAASSPPRGAILALAIPSVLAVAHLAVFYYIAFSRVSYPFELEWMEGGVLTMVDRVLEGLPLYVEPSVEYVPFIYTPLFYYVAAAVSLVLGHGFTTLRLVSIACTTVLFALIGWRTWRETKNPAAGVLAAGFLAAAFVPTGHWFDLGRVDMLWLSLTYGGALLACHRANLAGAAWGGALLGLALLTKQAALWPAAGLVLGLLVSDRKRAAAFAAGFVGAGLLPCLAAEARSDGWFSYYTLDCPAAHPLVDDAMVTFWTVDLWSASPILCLLAAGGLVLLVIHAGRKGPARVEFFFFAGLVASSWSSRLHEGGWFNVNIATFMVMGILAARWLARMAERAANVASPRVAALALGGLALLPTLHFASRWPDPSRQVPGPEDIRDGERIVQILRDAPGPVFAMESPYLCELAGKEGHANGIALIDVLRTSSSPLEEPIMKELLRRFRERRYALFLMHKPWLIIEPWYANSGTVEYEGDSFLPVIGPEGCPRVIYRPKPSVGG